MQKNWIGDIPNANVRDYQRKRLYNAEDSCLWGDMIIMTHKQVEELIYKISQWAEIAPPRLITDENSIAYATANIMLSLIHI